MYSLQINLPVSCMAPLSGQKHRFIPIYAPVDVSATADASHHLRISDVFGTNRTRNEALPAWPRDDL